MDEWFISLCFIAISTTTVLAFWFIKLSVDEAGLRKKRLPPGPWTLPIIGSLHHVASVLPHRTLMQLSRRHGPLMLLRLGQVSTVVVSSAEAAALVMKTNDPVFADRPRGVTLHIASSGGKDMVFAPYGDHWRQMRKICIVHLLGSAQVSRMEGIRAEEVGGLLRDIVAAASAGATINVSEKVMALSNDIVTRAVFGGKFARQREFLREMDKVFKLMSGFCLVDMFPSSRLVRWLSNGERHMRRCHGLIHRIIAEVVENRKAAHASATGGSIPGNEDLLDVLLRLQQEDSLEFPLTTETMGAVLFNMFAGATETTGTNLAWVMSELMHNPNIMAKAQHEVREVLGEGRSVITNGDLGELQYMRMIIKEALRLHPPGPLIPRMAREDCSVMGYDIPKGTNVYINIFAISRDPRYWINPEEFMPERFEKNNVNYKGTYFEFIPFGAGRRQCPGIQFSLAITEMALANLLYHFDWMLPNGANHASFDMSEKFGFAVSKKYDLKLRAIPHVWSNVTASK
ncbi:zealexin A1 synthase-like [Hordeum vulgare subsp. vulgare]|uniref:Predicted protein n=1 Tax=Hordeum vulgare subsp. vulgare TaxID=112509 RepID=F2CU49_HORVV|nr:zealexin A1 synthase-like [Hordeum vulgare subsp. vulgare]BAJ86370.1 predicted protein [Hordeum vulgare subsp. vulgare]